jgi:hypothetical protein
VPEPDWHAPPNWWRDVVESKQTLFAAHDTVLPLQVPLPSH